MVLFALVFNRKNSLNRDGKALVQIRAYQNGRARYFGTGIYLKPQHWARRISKAVDLPNSPQINEALRLQLHTWENFALEYYKKHRFISLECLDNFFIPAYANFNRFAAEELQTANISDSTRKTRKNTLKLLADFKDKIAFQDINYDFITRFDLALRRRGLSINTIAKHHQILRTFILIATKKDLMPNNPYQHFRIRTTPTERTALSPEELQRIEQLDLIGTLDQVRDMFLFSCYTGLRFSDIIHLRTADISTGAAGTELKIRAQKTQKILSLPLHLLFDGKPADIALYHIRTANRATVFQPLTNQAANRSLKQIAAMIGTAKEISMHIARHTFATSLVNKIPIAVLQQLLQHSDLKTTMIYIHTSNKTISNELKKVDWSA